MVLSRRSGEVRHRVFRDLADLLNGGDVVVLNETRVVPARFLGWKSRTGGRIEVLLLRCQDAELGEWMALARPLRGLRVGDRIALDAGAGALQVQGREGDRLRVRVCGLERGAGASTPAEPEDPTGFLALLPLASSAGQVPLPPYIRRPPEVADAERYQTVFARVPGSIAAPTAGLHFTEELLAALRARGVAIVYLILHVGPGTFAPIRCADPRAHRLEGEYFRLDEVAAAQIEECRGRGGRVVAVGTTTVRALETCAREGRLRAGSGWTDLFIHPPHEFRTVDALVTNFHLPQSSLLLLVSAFAGPQHLLAGYGEAVSREYRFYSYGDAMFIH